MGRRSTKSKNCSNKKKQQSPTTASKHQEMLLPPKMTKQSQKQPKNNEFQTSLRASLKVLIQVFQSRLSYKDIPYEIQMPILPQNTEKFDQVLSSLIMELIEDILEQVPRVHDLSNFLQEAFQCLTAAGAYLNQVSSNESAGHMCKLSYFYKILKPAWDVKKDLAKVSQIKQLFKELSSFAKDFKDLSSLPLENLVQLINGTSSSKIFARVYSDFSTESSNSPNRSIDSEVEELKIKLESCEKVLMRKKPLVSQEWISHLRRQLSEKP